MLWLLVVIIMTPMFLTLLSYDVHILLLTHWLDMRSLAILDIAVSDNASRPYWMMLLRSLRSGIIDDWSHDRSSLMWLITRGIHTRRVQTKTSIERVRVCDLLLLVTADIVHLGLTGCRLLTDQCIISIANVYSKLTSIDLNGCWKLTDAGMSALGTGCGQLQSIKLALCEMVTDVGISALSAGCGQLQSIYLKGCFEVTGAGVSALGAGCGQLQSIDLSRCKKVTDEGISALGAGCKQLQSILLLDCRLVTDAGVSALGAGCGQLQSIDLTGCYQATDAGTSALGDIAIDKMVKSVNRIVQSDKMVD